MKIILGIIWVGFTLCILVLAWQIGMNVLMKRAEKNPNYSLSQSFEAKITHLLDENKLPWFSVEELDGTIKETGFSLSQKTVHYPVQRTIQLHKKGEKDITYNYTFAIHDAKAQWALVRIWKEGEGIKKIGEDLPLRVSTNASSR